MSNSFLFIQSIGMEWILILFAILLLFGGKKIPELMRGVGKGIREFNTAKGNLEKELKEGMREEELREQRERDARELADLREREAKREREKSFITRNDD